MRSKLGELLLDGLPVSDQNDRGAVPVKDFPRRLRDLLQRRLLHPLVKLLALIRGKLQRRAQYVQTQHAPL